MVVFATKSLLLFRLAVAILWVLLLPTSLWTAPNIKYLLENIGSKFLQFRFNIGVFQKLIRICEIKHIKLQFWKNGWINPFGSYKLVNIIKILKEKKGLSIILNWIKYFGKGVSELETCMAYFIYFALFILHFQE